MSEKRYVDAEIISTGTEETKVGIVALFLVKTEEGEEHEAKTFLTGEYSQYVVPTLASIGLDATKDMESLDKAIGKTARISIEDGGDFGPKVYLIGPKVRKAASNDALQAAMAKLRAMGATTPDDDGDPF